MNAEPDWLRAAVDESAARYAAQIMEALRPPETFEEAHGLMIVAARLAVATYLNSLCELGVKDEATIEKLANKMLAKMTLDCKLQFGLE